LDYGQSNLHQEVSHSHYTGFDGKKDAKEKITNDFLVDVQQQMWRLNAGNAADIGGMRRRGQRATTQNPSLRNSVVKRILKDLVCSKNRLSLKGLVTEE